MLQVNGYTCLCPSEFTGVHCDTDVNECLLQPCINNGTCINIRDGFNCECPPGFRGSV